MLLGPADDRLEQLLQLEAVVQAVDRQPQFADEFGEGLELVRAGRFVDAAEERHALRAEQLGHRFVGGEHELLDHLVALGVLHDVRPGDAAL